MEEIVSSQKKKSSLSEELQKKEEENKSLKKINAQLLKELRELKHLHASLSLSSANAGENPSYKNLENLLSSNFTKKELNDIFLSETNSNSDENKATNTS
jgi:predicted RNase H-like nuclease (RuvC/YqgF family)